MKKKLNIILFILIGFVCNCYSQESFFITKNTKYQAIGNRTIETANGDFIIAYREQEMNLNEPRTLLFKYNAHGELINSKVINGVNGALIDVITHYNQEDNLFLIAGSTDSISFEGNQYRTPFIKIIDDELNTIYSSSWDPVLGSDNNFREIISYSDSIAYLIEICHPKTSSYYWLKVWEKNIFTNESTSFTAEYATFPHDMLILNDSILSVFYFGYQNKEEKNTYNYILNLDLDLNFISCTPEPSDMYLYTFAEKFTDSTYILSSTATICYQPMHSCRAMCVYEMTNNHDSINGVQYFPLHPADTILYPFMLKNIAISNNSIAIGGIYNMIPSGYPFQSSPCWVQLTLFDYDLNMEKQLYYGDGIKAYYGMDIIATSDGGFAMTGIVYDKYNQTNPQPDLFVLKVNSEGLMTGNNEMENSAMTEVILWPNPGNEKITIKTAMQLKEATFELYNTNGKLCLKESLTAGNTNTINTAALPAGIYPYRIINAGSVVGRGKWVKE